MVHIPSHQKGTKRTWHSDKEHNKRAALCTTCLSTWKAWDSEDWAGQQHWGMLGRALCLLPLEGPWASYISLSRPSDRRSSAATDLSQSLCSTSSHSGASDYARMTLHNSLTLIMGDLPLTIITVWTVWGCVAVQKTGAAHILLAL